MTDPCDICRGADGKHKLGCPNRPGYGGRVILSTPKTWFSDGTTEYPDGTVTDD